MANLKQTFPTPPASAIASYNYTDIAAGTGISVFYGGNFLDSSSNDKYALIDYKELAHNPTTRSAKNTDTTYTFDVEFNSPRILKGNCYAVVPFYASKVTDDSPYSITTTCYASLYKYDGSTETQIGSTVSASKNNADSGSQDKWEMLCPIFENSSEIHFARGDKIRLKIRIVNGDGASTSGGGFSHDPTNSSYTGTENGDCRTRVLSLSIPFKLTDL